MIVFYLSNLKVREKIVLIEKLHDAGSFYYQLGSYGVIYCLNYVLAAQMCFEDLSVIVELTKYLLLCFW